MEKEKIVEILKKVQNKKISVSEAFNKLRYLPYEDLGFAKVDHHRPLRTGMPEVIFCQGKTLKQIVLIFKSLWKRNSCVLLTRANKEIFNKISSVAPNANYNASARTITIHKKSVPKKGKIAIVTAGTADSPVAEEAAATAEIFGSKVERHYDVGVAGIHRLLGCFKKIYDSKCIVVVAGMDGALPSIIAGLSACPIIAVPTSVGYGSHFEGLASLLTMLNSCAPNVAVVNIDNGFGAGYLATLINRMGK